MRSAPDIVGLAELGWLDSKINKGEVMHLKDIIRKAELIIKELPETTETREILAEIAKLHLDEVKAKALKTSLIRKLETKISNGYKLQGCSEYEGIRFKNRYEVNIYEGTQAMYMHFIRVLHVGRLELLVKEKV